MGRFLNRLLTAIELTRFSEAFGAVSDLWFVILLTRCFSEYVYLPVVEDLTLFEALVSAMFVAVGLYAYGAALNDVMDVRHDAAFSPERPIPAGRIRSSQAIVMMIGALIVAALAANAMGTPALWITLLTATGILFFNATGRYVPGVGILTLGLISAAHMFIPNPQLTFTLPVWLVMTHSMVIAIAVHHWEDKRPRISTRALVVTIVGWLFWSALILGAGVMRTDGGIWPLGVSFVGIAVPLLAIAGFIAVAIFKTRAVSGRVAAEKLKRYGAMWQCLYGSAWLLGLGIGGDYASSSDLVQSGVWMAILALTGFAVMTVLRNASIVASRPITYRG